MTDWVTYVTGQVSTAALGPLHDIGTVLHSQGPDAVPWDDVAERVHAVLLRGEAMDAGRISDAPHLRIVARHGAGHDSVDVAAARAHGVAVTTTPGANARSVAEHAVALLLAVARQVGEADRLVRAGDWRTGRRVLMGRELSGGTLGVIGFGTIGRETARIAGAGFGMRVRAYDPYVSAADMRSLGVEPVGTVEEVLSSCEHVSLHLPAAPDGGHLLDDARLALVPEGTIIVNTARGVLVDHDALADALDRGQVGGAGLDVTDPEPLPEGHRLLDHPRVVVTPHLGGQTHQSMERVAETAVACIVAAREGRAIPHRVV